MAIDSNLDFILSTRDFLGSLKTSLRQENLDEKTLLQRRFEFQNEQLRFHKNLVSMIDTSSKIPDSVSEILDAIREVESIFHEAIAKQSSPACSQSVVKELLSIAHSFRAGDDAEGMRKFSSFVVQSKENIVETAVFYGLWVIIKKPQIFDIGRSSFYNDVAPAHISTSLQKALAIEMAMVRVVWRALENGDEQRAYTEFCELPSRIKNGIYLFLAQQSSSSLPEEERGRKCFFNLDGLGIEKADKIECLKTFEKQLGESYANANDQELVRLLQQSLREVQDAEHQAYSQLKTTERREEELFETLLTSQQVASRTIKAMQELQQSGKNEKPSPPVRLKPSRIRSYPDTLEGQRLAAYELKISQLIQEKSELEKLVQGSVDDEFVCVDNEPLPPVEQAFANFVHEKCPYYNIEDVKYLLREGKDLVERIQTGEAALIPAEARKNKAASLAWHMLCFAVCKNQGIHQETIVFRDPGHAIVKFLIGSGKGTVFPVMIEQFKDRLLPTFFDGKEMRTSYRINIPQNHKEGLPANWTTIFFSPIETQDGLDWSFMKLGAWGADLYQLMGFTRGYSAPRSGSVEPDIQKGFEGIYCEVMSKKAVPEKVKKFGIAGMKAVFEAMLQNDAIPLSSKVKMKQFLSKLRSECDYLNVRSTKGEALLGNSFINGIDPEGHVHSSIVEDSLKAFMTRDAQIRVKSAVHGGELSIALSKLRVLLPLTHVKTNIVDEVANGFKEGPVFNKARIFAQVQLDAMRNDNVNFRLDGEDFKGAADDLYQYLLAVEPITSLQPQDEREQEALRFMTLLQQGPSADLIGQLQQWYEQAVQGVRITARAPKPKEIVRSIIVNTGKNSNIEISQLFHLVGSDEECRLFYRKEPYALIEGKVKISFKEQTARMSATILEVN